MQIIVQHVYKDFLSNKKLYLIILFLHIFMRFLTKLLLVKNFLLILS